MSKYLDIPARFITESYADSVMEFDKTVENIQPVEEVCEECDMFIEIDDEMYYVSEYHNALFDDPDAHDEAINEFGILLDSYDDEIVQEVASYGPYDEYLKKHGYDPKSNTIEDPKRPGKRVSAGRIGSEKERRRMNRFLRENDYDPKTETIQTDVNDGNGGKKRVDFSIDPHDTNRSILYRKRSGEIGQSVSMNPSTIMQKLRNSTGVFKHEEGHIAQYDALDDPDKGRYKKGSDIERDLLKAKKYLDNMSDTDRTKINNSHDLDPEEYHADAYSELHNRYSKRGDVRKRALTKAAIDFEKKVKSIDSILKSRAKQYANRQIKRDKTIIEIIKNSSNNPGPNASNKDCARFLCNEMPNKWEIFLDYISFLGEFDELRQFRNDIKSKNIVTAREQNELNEKLQSVQKKSESGNVITAQGYVLLYKELAAKTKAELDQLLTDTTARKKSYMDEYTQKTDTIRHRDTDSFKLGSQKRGEYAQQQWKARDKQYKAEQAKKRQLSKEQLQQQIASGKLTKDQLTKAKRKLQRIEQFEKSQRK